MLGATGRRTFALGLLAAFVLAVPLARLIRRPRRGPPPAPASPPPDPKAFIGLIQRERPGAEASWPGYKPLDQPLLVTWPGRGSILMGAARTPRAFARSGELMSSFRTFDIGRFYKSPFDLDGATVTLLRVLPPWDADLEARTVFHERFHDFAGKRFDWKDAAHYVPYPVEDARDIALAWMENEALASWVETRSEEAMRDFAAARLRRRALFPAGAASERFEERNEGTAKFVELAAVESSTRSARLLADRLRAPQDGMSLHKKRAYGVGAAVCRWLDAAGAPDWRRHVESGRAPSDLVLERLKLSPDEVSRRARRLTSLPGYALRLRSAKDSLDELRRWRAQLAAHWDALEGRRLVLTSSATRAAFSGGWTDFPDGSSLLVVKEYSVDLPEITVRLTDQKGIWRRMRGGTEEHTFVVPPSSTMTLDGKPWRPAPGRYAFKTFAIREQRIQLDAGPGTLDDDGTYLRLRFPGKK